MARILQALRNLQTQTLGPAAEPEETPSGKGAVSSPAAASPKMAIQEPPQPTIVLDPAQPSPAPPPKAQPPKAAEPKPTGPKLTEPEPAERKASQPKATESKPVAPPAPSPLQNELIEKLTRQLAQALRQRDAVAKEVQQMRQTLESHDRQKDEEVARLRNLLEGHEQSARSLEEELKQQLERQQAEFAQKLGEFEKRLPADPATGESAARVAASPPAPPTPSPAPAAQEKPIPQLDPLRAALEALTHDARSQEIASLAKQLLGTAPPEPLADPVVIFLGSCHPGRTTEQTTLQLALWISQQGGGHDVLVIDGALREKTLSQQLGLRSSPGIFEMVRRENHRQDGLYRDAQTGLGFIPAGRSTFLLTPNDQDALGLRDELLELLKRWPVILISGEGPDLSASRLFATLAMRSFLEAELGKVSALEVTAAVEAFRREGIEPAGLIATHAPTGCYT